LCLVVIVVIRGVLLGLESWSLRREEKKNSWFVGCFLSEDADGNGGGRRGAEEEEEEKEREGGDDDSFRASVSTLLLLFLPWF
jgi:hypothetical protein